MISSRLSGNPAPSRGLSADFFPRRLRKKAR